MWAVFVAVSVTPPRLLIELLLTYASAVPPMVLAELAPPPLSATFVKPAPTDTDTATL